MFCFLVGESGTPGRLLVLCHHVDDDDIAAATVLVWVLVLVLAVVQVGVVLFNVLCASCTDLSNLRFFVCYGVVLVLLSQRVFFSADGVYTGCSCCSSCACFESLPVPTVPRRC